MSLVVYEGGQQARVRCELPPLEAGEHEAGQHQGPVRVPGQPRISLQWSRWRFAKKKDDNFFRVLASFSSVLPPATLGVCSFLAITKMISPPPPAPRQYCTGMSSCKHPASFLPFSSFATIFLVVFHFPSWSFLCLTQSHSHPFRPF